MSPHNAIEIRGLGHRFGEHRVLDALSLEVPRGTVFGLLGRNGAGKSTTLQLVMGLLRRQQGTIEVLGHDPAHHPLAVRAQVGYVPEQPRFYPWMRVAELIGFVACHRPGWDAAWASELRHRFGLDEGRRIEGLSKGETAMLALLIAVAFRPALLVLDEPVQGLDPVARRRFFEGVLAGYGDDGGTVVISSHLIRDISTLVDHVALLAGGTLLCAHPVDVLRRRVRAFRVGLADAASDNPGDRPGELAGIQILSHERAGRQERWVIDMGDLGPPRSETREAELMRCLGRDGAARVEEESLDLEELFFALAGGGD